MIKTNKCSYKTRKIVISCGAYIRKLVKNIPVEVQEKKLVWFKGAPKDLTNFQNIPVYTNFHEVRTYGFPDLGKGLKTAIHYKKGENHDLDDNLIHNKDRKVTQDDVKNLQDSLKLLIPNLKDATVESTAICYYTVTPDKNFIIDFYNDNKDILILSCCSGHGFKFTPVIGKIASDLILTNQSEFNLSYFKLDRFKKKPKF